MLEQNHTINTLWHWDSLSSSLVNQSCLADWLRLWLWLVDLPPGYSFRLRLSVECWRSSSEDVTPAKLGRSAPTERGEMRLVGLVGQFTLTIFGKPPPHYSVHWLVFYVVVLKCQFGNVNMLLECLLCILSLKVCGDIYIYYCRLLEGSLL